MLLGSQALTNDPYFNNVSLLLSARDGVIKDYSKNNRSITNSGVTVSSTQAKWGNKSFYFDGAFHYLSGALASSFNIRTTPHQIEAWVYFLSTYNAILFNSDENYYPLEIYQGNWYVGDAVINNISGISTSGIIQNNWNYVSILFDGTTYKLILNDSVIASSTTLLKNVNISNFQIGGRTAQSIYLNGYISELRLTVGVVRPIQVPTQPFPNW